MVRNYVRVDQFQPTRRDTLPEHAHYKDDGCDLTFEGIKVSISDCLSCPLPICKFDDAGWLVREERDRRDRAIVRFRAMGWPVDAVAQEMDIGVRTVHRVLKLAKEAVA